MIDSVICAPDEQTALARVLSWLGADARIACEAPPAALSVSLGYWQGSRLDMLALDRAVHEREGAGERFCLELRDGGDAAPAFFEQVLTRYQRLLRFAPQPDQVVTRVLARHRALFDLSKPLVRADYDHALDTWRWTLRLDLGASRALQLAALFHDVERLHSEPERRVEHLAPDYLAFKQRHARAGARMTVDILNECGLAPALVARVRQLVERHESPSDDDELAALNDADALSFFSLNSWGFVEYFGLEHSRAKVAYTFARMRPAARRYLTRFRYHPWLNELLRAQLGPAAPARYHQEAQVDT